jgi:hypothetical protein
MTTKTLGHCICPYSKTIFRSLKVHFEVARAFVNEIRVLTSRNAINVRTERQLQASDQITIRGLSVTPRRGLLDIPVAGSRSGASRSSSPAIPTSVNSA